MTIDYFPLDFNKVDKFFEEAGYFNNTKEKELKLFDLFNNKFCKYIDKNGKICGRKSRIVIKNHCCKQHLKILFPDLINTINNTNNNSKTYYIKKEILNKCSWINNRNKLCNRNVKNEGELCFYHKNKNSNPPNNLKNNKLKEKNKNEILDFSIYRNMGCMEYLTMENFNMKILSNIYTSFKNNIYNFTLKNGYYYVDNNTNKNGNGLLNLIMYIYNLDVYKSCLFIKDYMKNNNISFQSFSLSSNNISNLNGLKCKNNLNLLNIKNKEYKKIPKPNKENINNIIKYLKEKRKLHKGIINSLIKKDRIYADDNNNVVFTNKEKTFSIIRNINNSYKSCAGKPDFIIYKNIDEDIEDTNIYMFESPIDSLSFMTLYPNIKGIYISINGNMLINKISNLEIVKKCKILHLCFDNDEAGNNFCNIIINSKIKDKSLIVVIKPICKDFNEDLNIC